MLKNKKIILGVSGGIAAYKSVDLASFLHKQGAQVETILTPNATKIIAPAAFFAVTGKKPHNKLFSANDYIPHITLNSNADLLVVAPATANILAKAAQGIADDLLSTAVLAATCPVLFVPAMNADMYANKIVQRNIKTLEDSGYFILEPDYGLMACGTTGKGRFPKVEEIVYAIKTYLYYQKDLSGRNFLITAGATREQFDPMRFISNYSSGKMGLALARAAALRGAKITFVHAHIEENIPYYLEAVNTLTAKSMYEYCTSVFPEYDTTLMCAAVSDYTPASPLLEKHKKTSELNINFRQTPDILRTLGESKHISQTLVGFAAESSNLIVNAEKKLKEKNLDFIIANNLKVVGSEQTEAMIISAYEKTAVRGDKFAVAHEILTRLVI